MKETGIDKKIRDTQWKKEIAQENSKSMRI